MDDFIDFIDLKEELPINVRFEYINVDGELTLSERFTVNLRVLNNRFEDLEVARITIINNCNFKTLEERFYYYIFDKKKYLFFNKNSDISPYLPIKEEKKGKKDKKEPQDLIMVNYKIFVKQICEILNKEVLTYTKKNNLENKQILLNNSNKVELKRTLNFLQNYLKIDFFVEEFIKNNGFYYLDRIIRHNKGNIRGYALECLLILFEYQKCFEYFYQNLEFLSILYDFAVNSHDYVRTSIVALDLIIKIIAEDEIRTMYIIEVAEKYAKKTNTKLFQGIVNNLSIKNLQGEVKLNSIFFINLVLNYCEPNELSRILIELKDTEIFENLEEIKRKKIDSFQDDNNELNDQINLFLTKANEIFSLPETKQEIIKKYINDMKNHIKVIETRYNSLIEEREFYEYIIKEFIQYLDVNDNIIYKNNIKVGEIKSMSEAPKEIELKELKNKYATASKKSENLRKIYKNLIEENRKVKNEQIYELEKEIKIEEELSSKIQIYNEVLEKKIQEIEIKITKEKEKRKLNIPISPENGVINIPLPTKQKINLPTKVRHLPWQRVILSPESSKNGSDLIWAHKEELKLDIDEVIYRFGIRKVDIKKFLDDTRRYEVYEIIEELPEPEVIENALLTFDQTLLNKEQIDLLLKILITEDELDMLINLGEDGYWDGEEKYLIKINNIPNHKPKLNILSLIFKFEEKMLYLNDNLINILNVCENIRSNKHFLLILSIILALGNILNGDSNLGQADGFRLEILEKLPQIKDNEGNSILYYICSKAYKIDSSFEGFKDLLPKIEKVVQFKIEEENNGINELKEIIEQIRKLLKNLPDDQFKKKSEEYFINFTKEIKKLEEFDINTKDVYKKLIIFYGYNDYEKICENREIFFEMIFNFFEEIDKAFTKPSISLLIKRANKKIDQNLLMKDLMSKLKSKVKKEMN